MRVDVGRIHKASVDVPHEPRRLPWQLRVAARAPQGVTHPSHPHPSLLIVNPVPCSSVQAGNMLALKALADAVDAKDARVLWLVGVSLGHAAIHKDLQLS